MNNKLDFDLNLSPPSSPSNVTLPSYNQTPRRKRTRTSSNNETSSSSSRRKPAEKPNPNAPLITEPCKVCGRKFWSSKALHGHMRSHPERQWRGTNPPPPQDIVDVDHRCDVCSKVFSSGQALGGHMKCHWHKDQKEKNQASTSSIDLNIPESTNLPSSSSDTLSEGHLDLTLRL